MAIVRATSAASTPAALADWQRAVAQLELAHKNGASLSPAVEISGSWYVPRGFSFYHRGTVYYAESDTLISGTKSSYIQMTASGDGSSCTAAFLASLSGVAWDDTWNGYFDGSDNLVIVDEFIDANQGDLEPKTKLGELGKKLANLSTSLVLEIGSSLSIGGDLAVEQDLSVEGDVVFSGELSGAAGSTIANFRKRVVGYSGATPPFIHSFIFDQTSTISTSVPDIVGIVNVEEASFDQTKDMDIYVLHRKPSTGGYTNFDRFYVVAKDDDDIFGKAYDGAWDRTLLASTTNTPFTGELAIRILSSADYAPGFGYTKYTIPAGIPDTKWLVFFARAGSSDRGPAGVCLLTETSGRAGMYSSLLGQGAASIPAGTLITW